MKEYEGDKTLRRVFESRQLGLKLIANVTYGYTSANFSGRMPCVELGDSVVSKGRETLERAIHLIEERSEWKARVVYGDTDSVFVLLPGRSREEAFKIGDEIAQEVTQANPQPVKLKFEKVYQPCILQVKTNKNSSNVCVKSFRKFTNIFCLASRRLRRDTSVTNTNQSIRKNRYMKRKASRLCVVTAALLSSR